MSMKRLEQIARIETKREAARMMHVASRLYVEGLMGTVEYMEFRRFIARRLQHLSV